MTPITELWDGKVIIKSMDDYNAYVRAYVRILELITSERWPLMVRYDQRGVAYVPRERFYFPFFEPRCSDCVWIVPGSTP